MRAAAAVAAVSALVAVTAGVAVTATSGGSADDGERPVTVSTTTAAVRRMTLVERESVDGTLGYGKTTDVANRLPGTVTSVPELGSIVERNGVLYAIDAKPVRLLYGSTPAYRKLAEGVADGEDVKQLEQNLIDLGHAKGLLRTADPEWTTATTNAVKRWEKALDVDENGVVEDGEVVFMPGAVRIAGVTAPVGSPTQPGGSVVQTTGTSRLITVPLEARKQRLAQKGAKVEVELPDGTTVPGTITSVATVATAPPSGQGQGQGREAEPTIDVVVVLDDPNAGGSLDGAPVDVEFASRSRPNVLVVPVAALVALSEGGYAVELAADHRLVRVETGLFSEGLVEVSGDGLAEGAEVVVPK